jgi:mono/diheme cytochrome c family protein
MESKRSSRLLAAFATGLFAVVGVRASAENNDIGRRLYGRYCSACHGAEGKGDGVVSQFMRPKPADLTLLAKKNNGVYPFYEIIRTIDGRETKRAHGGSDMPVWGEIFSAEEGTSDEAQLIARGKVVVITDYLEQIQQK